MIEPNESSEYGHFWDSIQQAKLARAEITKNNYETLMLKRGSESLECGVRQTNPALMLVQTIVVASVKTQAKIKLNKHRMIFELKSY